MALPFLIAGAIGLQAVSSITQSRSIRDNANRSSAAILANAELEFAEGLVRAQLLDVEARRRSRESTRNAGRVVAGLAGNQGLSGSALDVLADVAREQEIEISLAFHQAELEKASTESRRDIAQVEARNVRRAGKAGSNNSLIGGVSGIANSLFGAFG